MRNPAPKFLKRPDVRISGSGVPPPHLRRKAPAVRHFRGRRDTRWVESDAGPGCRTPGRSHRRRGHRGGDRQPQPAAARGRTWLTVTDSTRPVRGRMGDDPMTEPANPTSAVAASAPWRSAAAVAIAVRSQDVDQEGAPAALQHHFDCSAAGDEDGAHEIYLDDGSWSS